MNSNRIAIQTPTWFSESGKRKGGRSRKSWGDMLSEDLQNIEMTWDDFGEVTDDRSLWKSYYRSVTTTRGRNALTCRIASRIFSSTVTVKADGSRSAEIFKLLDSHCSIAGLQKNSNSGECSFKAPRKSRKINEDTCGGTCPSV